MAERIAPPQRLCCTCSHRVIRFTPMMESSVVDPRYLPPTLDPGKVLDDVGDEISTDILIVGAGMAGSMLAYAMREAGREVLITERGGFLPREPQNTDPTEMYLKGRYKNAEHWYDGHNGATFAPGVYYWAGGNTRFWGACVPRFRSSDFEEVEHQEGTSRAWPFSYDELEPFYAQAEAMFGVHGRTDEDPTEPFHSSAYPHAALDHEPAVDRLASSLRAQGLHPSHAPNAMNALTAAERASVTTADGCPDNTGLKSDAENRALLPALLAPGTSISTHTEVLRLLSNGSGDRVIGVEARKHGRVFRIRANQVILSTGAVNSAALLLRSATQEKPTGLANSSDLVGRNYMVHNSTFFVGVNPLRRNDTSWQKTLMLNDWYESGPGTPYPLGNLQMLGKLQGAMVKGARPWAPMWALDFMTSRSIDIYLTTEDLPSLDNRVRVDGERTLIEWTPTNVAPHHELVRRVTKAVRRAGYPLVFTQRMGIETNSHMCGTLVAGHDPSTSVLDPWCRSHDVENLWVVDSSFFPSSAALNPGLTIGANALRVAPRILES